MPPPTVRLELVSRSTNRSPGRGCQWPVQHQLYESGIARHDRFIAQNDDAAGNLRGGVMNFDREPLAYRFPLRRQYTQACIDAGRGRIQHSIEHHIPAVQSLLADARSAENQSAALPRFTFLHGLVLRVDRTDARVETGWAYSNVIADANCAGEYGAGDGGAIPGERKGAIHCETEAAFARPNS